MSVSYSITTGGATDEEVAALVTVLQAHAMADDRLKAADDRPLAGGWKSYYRTVRQQLAFGRDAWRTYIRF
ncbi:MAG: acyl-CoA carboxylase subunit epsilon [Propionibacteriaceae bacterium]|nr:acyl-CoA carboxylase subunit epsilon [Propionibacteriaceae bacterium]